MSFRLAIVGHSSSIADIKQIVSESFDNVETQGIELSNDEMTDSAVASLRTMLPQLDGVLYTRNDPYKLVVSRLDHADVVSGYADIDATSLVQCLLIASYHMHADICRISVDTLDYDTVMRTYDALGISSEKVHPTIVSVDNNASHFVDSTTQAHRESYRSGLCSICVTNIRSIRDTLENEGIPCLLLTPSRERYINEIRRLMLQRRTEHNSYESGVVIRIRAELSTDYYIHRKTLVQNVLDLGKLTESIVMFAQLMNGAFFHLGEQEFAVICSHDAISTETDHFTKLNLLGQVYSGTPYRLAVGIGFGSSMRTALINAELGTQRAWVEGCNRAYLVNGEDQIIGPIEPNELYNIHQTLFDRHLTKAAEDCGLSINTIFRIDTFVRRKNNGSFMTAELCDELHISFRTAARIVEKLECSGYIVEIGRSVVNGRGRPTRLFKLLW